MAIYFNFVTAPYAVFSYQLAMLFVYNGLETVMKRAKAVS
jgi:hypothetical protein